ncbi:hypothetical protein ABGB17_34405 [Sphaerisporangium sp. B11E5]|uniref:hypothetical protein n=1 Tax=Sphaerisporangium sp. B11E5 TaxID=3153563 RepID=UPI00325F42BE
MRHPKAALTATASLALCAASLAGCSRPAGSPSRAASTPPSPAVSTATAATTAAPEAEDCAVTEPADRKAEPPAGVPRDGEDRWYGEGVLWVSLPDPSYRPEKGPDGYAMKVGWWRLAEGPLTVGATRVTGAGNRRDVGKGTMVPHIPSGYGPTGFQAGGLGFPEPGCWHVTATLAGTSIDFRVRVA